MKSLFPKQKQKKPQKTRSGIGRIWMKNERYKSCIVILIQFKNELLEGSLLYLFETLANFVNKIKSCKKFKVIMWIFEDNDAHLLTKTKLKHTRLILLHSSSRQNYRPTTQAYRGTCPGFGGRLSLHGGPLGGCGDQVPGPCISSSAPPPKSTAVCWGYPGVGWFSQPAHKPIERGWPPCKVQFRESNNSFLRMKLSTFKKTLTVTCTII